MGNCDSDFAHKDVHSSFENHHRVVDKVLFLRAKKELLISHIDLHFSFIFLYDILGIMSI